MARKLTASLWFIDDKLDLFLFPAHQPKGLKSGMAKTDVLKLVEDAGWHDPLTRNLQQHTFVSFTREEISAVATA